LKTDFLEEEGLPPDSDLLEEYDSQETVERIASALGAAGHDPVKLGGGRKFLEQALAGSRPPRTIDLVFNIAEGRNSRCREAHVPAACEMLGIPYTHSDPLTLALSLDKPLANRVAASFGIPTAPHVCVEHLADLDSLLLPPFPLIAKPACEGSSMGIRRNSRCENRDELQACVASLLAHYTGPVMVERFLTGIEATVGIVGTGAEARVLGVMEIAPCKTTTDRFIYSLEVKRDYLREVEYHVPPRLPAAVNDAIARTGLRAYRAIGCRDVGRVDVRLDAEGVPCFIEVNPLPGLNPVSSDLPILAGRLGISYETLIATIVENAIARQPAVLAALAST
jgi:D-alanine-D-alanine ligase